MLVWMEVAAATARHIEDSIEEAFNAFWEPHIEAYWAAEYQRVINGDR
jgi:hypothetical protein